MALRHHFREEEGPCRMYSVISCAVSEWLLMLLLFMNGVVSFSLTKFARYCKLLVPCVFCSRLDHFLGSERPGFYRNLICDAHKLEIASLAYCHAHRTLADVREMCDVCLLSFASAKKLNMDSYRSLVRKLEINLDTEEPGRKKLHETTEKGCSRDEICDEVVHLPELKRHILDFLRKRHCSCCHRHFRMRSHAHRLLQTTSLGAEIAKTRGVTMDLMGCDRMEPRDQEDRFSHGSDILSHVGYSELKRYSDSEPEFPPPDGDDGRNLRSTNRKTPPLQPNPAISDDDLVHPSLVEPETGVADEKQVFEIGSLDVDVAKPASSSILSHGLEELNWNDLKLQATPSKSQSTDAKSDAVEIGDVTCVSTRENAEQVPNKLAAAATNLEPLKIGDDQPPLGPTNTDLSDAYKLAIAGRGIEPTPSPRDPNRAQEDLRLLLFQLSSARGLDLPASEATPSPRICRICEEAKPSDRSGPTGLQSVTRRFSTERNESGLPSLDESVFGEIEGESTVDGLKRLIEFERRSLILLYRELEEERSASAIAANQAMAMITRLQEEKASMQMEALQYQRMMEEQAEYDQEALQRSNDLLAQNEKEIQQLELEIHAYRVRFMEQYQDGVVISEEEMEAAGKIYATFEDEKIYLSKCLKRLEKKLRLYSTKGLHAARYDASEEDEKNGHCNSLEFDQTGRNASSVVGVYQSKNPHLKLKKLHKSVAMENGKYDSSSSRSDIERKQSTFGERDKDIIATVNMVSQLSERLEMLEIDKNLLEHTIRTLRKGNQGLQFIQEIASHLQDLRKIMAGKQVVI